MIVAKRYVRFYDLVVNSKARYEVNGEMTSAPVAVRPLVEILKEAVAIYEKRDCFYREIGSGVKYYLADIEVDEAQSKATLLVNKSDPTEPDQTISNPIVGERDKLVKPDGFGNDYSAHICISLLPSKPNLYSLVYESPRGGIPGTQVHAFLNFMMRECRSGNKKSYKVPHPAGVQKDGKAVMVNALHQVDLNGKISDDFFRDLQNGELGKIILANYQDSGVYWDQGQSFKQEKKQLILRPEISDLEPAKFLDALKGALTKGRAADYEKAVIVFKDESEVSRTVEVNTDDMTLSDDERYVKKTFINVAEAGDSGYEEISDEIKLALYRLL